MSGSNDKKTVPYTKASAIDSFFKLVENKKAPPVVDTAWAKSLDLEASRPSSVPKLLNWLGVIDAQGEPDKDRWDSIRHVDTRPEALERLIRDAYSDLFDATEAERETREQLRREFARVYDLGNADERVTCFLKLCEVAGMAMVANGGDGSPSSGSGARSEGGALKSSGGTPMKKTRAKQQDRTPQPPNNGVTFVVSFSVEIPAEWSEEQIAERVRAVQRAVEGT
jgi:hypothetical protein